MSEQAGVGWFRRTGFVALVAAALWLWMCQATRMRLLDPSAAPQASPLTVRALDGTAIEVGSLRGQVVAVNLWASWCGPCRDETPGLIDTYEQLATRGFRLVGVNVESLPTEELARISREWGIVYTVAVPAGPLNGTFSHGGVLPHTWLIDRQGRVRASHSGYLLGSSLRSAVGRLLEEPTSP